MSQTHLLFTLKSDRIMRRKKFHVAVTNWDVMKRPTAANACSERLAMTSDGP